MLDTTQTSRSVPGPTGGGPLGMLSEYNRNPIAFWQSIQHRYGDVARVRVGPYHVYQLVHPEHVQHVLVNNHKNYVRGRFYENFKLIFGEGLLTTDGEFWRSHRRAVQPAFHNKAIHPYCDVLAKFAIDQMEKWRALPPGQVLDVVPEMMGVSLRMLGGMVFNMDLSPYVKEIGPLVRIGLEVMTPQGNFNDLLPRWVPSPFNLRVRRTRKRIEEIIGRVLVAHDGALPERPNLISMLLTAHERTDMPALTEKEVLDEVITTFLAGHETTGMGMAWTLYTLAQHPIVLRRLREELDARLNGGAPDIDDLANLPYLKQVVNETLRLYPPIWGLTRDTINEDEIGGFHVPADASIFFSPYITHRHPDFWNNPEAFDPENFAAHGLKRHKLAYFPFGDGGRKCIGYQMALIEMQVLVAVIAQHFDLALVPGHSVACTPRLVTLRPAMGIRMILRPRQRGLATLRPTDPAERPMKAPVKEAI